MLSAVPCTLTPNQFRILIEAAKYGMSAAEDQRRYGALAHSAEDEEEIGKALLKLRMLGDAATEHAAIVILTAEAQ